jgi:hypothetical protein
MLGGSEEQMDRTRYGGFCSAGGPPDTRMKPPGRRMAKGREGGPMLCPNSVLTGRTIHGEAGAERFANPLILHGAQEGTRTPTPRSAST